MQNVSKSYRLFGRRSNFQTLKSALLKRQLIQEPESSSVALHDISFNVEKGEAFGIIGRNGSGKSSLLKIVSGIFKPTTGKVVVDGRLSALIELGAGFHPEISGRENIYINGIMLGLTKREIAAKFARIVEFAGIGEYLEQPVKTYSSGMYVRLGFSVAVHVDPDILLIDEVLAVGDEEFSQKCVAKIQEMKLRGVTMLFVTHQLDHVRNLCDRALWLDHGQMASIGDPVRVSDDYLQSVSQTTRKAAGAAPAVEIHPIPEAVEDVEGDSMLEEERWGSGEVLLAKARIVGIDGSELVALGAGTAVTLEMEIEVREPQTDFVVGVGIYSADGTCVYGTNTDLEGWVSRRLHGNARVLFSVPSLDLVAGTYRFDAALHTRNGRAFDYRRGVIRFVVGSRVHDIGIYRPQHSWTFAGDIELTPFDTSERDVPAQMLEALKELDAANRSSASDAGDDSRKDGKTRRKKTGET
ncbi:MAG TPA: ABC transporter ATP-binding protein [Thermoanaerobaculia bacterium]|nr:ABC transporter ATP-binding protein [Thermoanaerobaculia bacterium]